MTVKQKEEKSDVILLTVNDINIQRAEDVINTVLVVYNQNWINDRNQIAISTSKFIDERLGVIEHELGNVESDISSYKSQNLIPEIGQTSGMYMQQAQEANTAIIELNTQLSMARYVKDFIANTGNKYQLLPANTGVGGANSVIASQISAYNNMILQRNALVANSSEENPLVLDMNADLNNMRNAIVQSVDNEILQLNAKIKSQQQSEGQALSKMASNPNKERYLLSVERQQKVKESLYLYLLQKREENELSQAFTAYNTRLISSADGSNSPIAPNRRNIFLIGLMIGLAIPACIIYLTEILNSKVRGRADLEHLTAPFIGEIPLAPGTKISKLPEFINKLLGRDSVSGERKIVIKRNNRNIINEAFRVIRTNLDLIISRDPDKHVIAITSFNPGSGKSFVSMNLAVALAIKGKRVLVIDGDLRHGSLSDFVNNPKVGICDYLRGQINSIDEITVQLPDYPTLDVIPTGKIPPNPTELLEDSRFAQLIEDARSHYDYIFVDCPPLEIVADTQIIEQSCDRTIFIVRAGVLERSMINDLENIYRTHRLKNVAVILNGTESSGSKYGYRYGYNYGYYGDKSSSYYSKDE